MKIALVGPVYPFRGGIAHYTTRLCKTLREEGHTVLLVSFKRQYPKFLFPGRSDIDPSREPLVVEGANFWIDSLNPFTWLVSFKRIHQFRPEVLVLQWWTAFWAPLWFCFGVMTRVVKGGPITFICHNVLPHERRALDPCLTRGVLRWGDQCIVQSDEEAQLLRFLLPGARIKIQPHPLYDFFSHQRIPQPEARRKLNLPAAGLVFLFFGIVRRYKGLLELLEWWPAIRSEWSRAVLFIAGEFWDSRELYLARIKALGIGDSVVIDDRYIPNEELGIHFSAADVVLAPYLRKTGSGVAQMARGFGKPVVTGRGEAGSEQGILAEIRKALLHRPPNATGGEAVRDDPEEPAANWPDLVRLICGP